MWDPFEINADRGSLIRINIGGIMNECDFSGFDDEIIKNLRDEFEGTSFSSEQECNQVMEIAGRLLKIYQMMQEPTYYPSVHQRCMDDVATAFPIAARLQGRDVFDAFGLRDCVSQIPEYIEKARRIAALEEEYYGLVKENLDKYWDLAKQGEVFG